MRPAPNVHDKITRTIIAAIERGAAQYQMPWNSSANDGSLRSVPANPIGRDSYRGINALALWASQITEEFPTCEWATFRQWQTAGANVRRVQKGTPIVFWRIAEGAGELAEHAAPSQTRAVIKTSCVFNLAQVDGFVHSKVIVVPSVSKGTADSLINTSGATIHHGETGAFYDPVHDQIWLPHKEFFNELEGYYSVAFHELAHWTGHESRCARDLKGRFGSESYAVEELVAELGAAFLCAEVGLSTKPRPDHAQYIQSWLRVLKNDTRAVFAVVSKATQASAFLLQSSSAKSESQ